MNIIIMEVIMDTVIKLSGVQLNVVAWHIKNQFNKSF